MAGTQLALNKCWLDCTKSVLSKLLVAQSCPTLCDPVGCSPPTRPLCPWDSPGKNTGVGCHALLQGIFPTQGSNPRVLHLLHCRQILYCLSCREALKTSSKTTLARQMWSKSAGIQMCPGEPSCAEAGPPREAVGRVLPWRGWAGSFQHLPRPWSPLARLGRQPSASPASLEPLGEAPSPAPALPAPSPVSSTQSRRELIPLLQDQACGLPVAGC